MKSVKIILGKWTAAFISAFLVLLAGACESVLFIELEEADRLIVVSGAISNDSVLSVQVSRTRHILDNASVEPLDKATVTLYRNGTMIEQLSYGWNGFYFTDHFFPDLNVEYMIEVENAGYESVSARCEIPDPVQIEAVDTATVSYEFGDEYYWGFNEGWLQFDLSLQDPGGEENYYLLNTRVNRSFREWRDTTVVIIDSLYYGNQWNYFPRDSVYTVFDISRYMSEPFINSDDIVVEAVTSQGILFSDKLIDGTSYSFRGQIFQYELTSADSAVVDLRLHSISESYYKYLKSRQKHFETKENYLAVPVIVFSNVESGTGFLGGFSSDVYTFSTFIPDYYDNYWYYD